MGTIAELQSKPDRDYPLLWLSNEGGSLDQNYKVDNIRLTMFGRVIAGEEGQDDDASEIEVLSDMQLILLDFLNYFHQQHGEEYVTDKAAQLEHFTERTNDRTAGYSCVLELKQFYDWNKCQIPESGASIPPTVDGLTLYDFCDQSVIDRLTQVQRDCLIAEFGNCADATVQINSVTVATIPSGDTDSFTVNLDGTPSGNWDGTAWQVTSAPCADATVQLNGVDMTDIPSGDTENILVLQSSGMTQVGSKQGVHWRVGDATVENSDSSYSTTVEAEGSLVIPNTPISANGDLIVNQPSTIAKDVVVRYETLGVVPTTITGGEVVVPDSTPTPTPTITKGLSFDGVNDYAVTGLPKIDLDEFSVSFFFQMATTAGRTELYSFQSGTSTRPAQGMYYENNAFTFLSLDFYSFSQTLPWTGDTDSHHFVMRYDTIVNAVEIFIDGISLGVCATPVNYTNQLWSLLLGRAFAFSGYGDVKMTDVRVFNHYLTTGEIATLQTAGTAIGNEVLWYPFLEDIGETDFCTDIVTGYELALYNFTSPFGVIAFTP